MPLAMPPIGRIFGFGASASSSTIGATPASAGVNSKIVVGGYAFIMPFTTPFIMGRIGFADTDTSSTIGATN